MKRHYKTMYKAVKNCKTFKEFLTVLEQSDMRTTGNVLVDYINARDVWKMHMRKGGSV
jgi:ribosome-associated toxin RatA of RatAB toxin-antitoxin module